MVPHETEKARVRQSERAAGPEYVCRIQLGDVMLHEEVTCKAGSV
jgi:hypothetical protein